MRSWRHVNKPVPDSTQDGAMDGFPKMRFVFGDPRRVGVPLEGAAEVSWDQAR
jgi:hypothetical protein